MRFSTFGLVSVAVVCRNVAAFSVANMQVRRQAHATSLFMSPPPSATTTAGGFIETELRGMAMKLHTKSQAPKEGQAQEKERAPYTPTQSDYLKFLCDSQHIYKVFEDVINKRDELTVFRETGLERVEPLEKDIKFMMSEYNLDRPEVGKPGLDYAAEIRSLGEKGAIPEFLCHYYNFYFAHTAGGRMIGKKMSALLLDKKTLAFYKVCKHYRRTNLKYVAIVPTS